MLSAMGESQQNSRIESMKEAIKETETKITSGEVPSAGGYGGGAIPEPLPLQEILAKQKKALSDLESGV